MKGRTIIITLGFDPSVVLKIIGEHGLSNSSRVVLITPKTSHPKAKNAIKEIQNFIEKINNNVKVSVLKIEENKFEENIIRLKKFLSKFSETIVDISGGPRILALTLYIASGIAGIPYIYLTLETTGERIKLPTISLPRSSLTERQKEILSLLPEKPIKIARKIRLSKSAVSRHLKILVNKGLATKHGDQYYPTITAKTLLTETNQLS
ncbi:MAG: CRISPR-associated CARF protein Csa3 [Thermoprotei archaeon]